MATDGFQPPDLLQILKTDTIDLICTILLQQCTQTKDTLSRALDIRQHDRQHIFLSDASLYQRIRTKDTGIACQGFCLAHCHIAFIKSGLSPDTFIRQGIRHCRIAHRVIRQINLYF